MVANDMKSEESLFQPTDQHPCEESSPRKIIARSIIRPQHVHEVFLYGHAGHILPILQLHGREIWISLCLTVFIHKAVISTNFHHGSHHEDEGSNHHEDGLDKVSPDDRRQSTTYCENSSNDKKNQDGQVEARFSFQSKSQFDVESTGQKISLVGIIALLLKNNCKLTDIFVKM